MILDQILTEKQNEIALKKQNVPLATLIESINKLSYEKRAFKEALKQKNGIPALIAEVKKASPSKGILRESFDPIEIARIYEENGASAISVLTDEKFFKGHLDYLKQIKEKTSLPILRKDFIIDKYQVYEAKVFGADAILLIVSALKKDTLQELQNLAWLLDLDVLVEVHDENEMQIALECKCNPIGVNNRNLKTFEVNLETTFRLRPIAQNCTFVSESGIFSRSDVKKLAEAGVDAVLIGEALMKEDNIAKKIREFVQ